MPNGRASGTAEQIPHMLMQNKEQRELTSSGIFAIGERLATIKMTMAKYGMGLTRTCPLWHFTRKDISPDACAMLQAIGMDKPKLLWIQWNDSAREPNRRPQVRTALEFITGLVDLQLKLGGDVIMEGRACDVPVRDELMAGDKKILTIIGPPVRVHWCALGIKGGKEHTTRLCGEHLVLSNKPWATAPCVCERQSSTYHPSAGAGYEQFVEKVLVRYGFLMEKDIKPINARWHELQAQLKQVLKDTANDVGFSASFGNFHWYSRC